MYMIKKNEGVLDRLLRATAGAALLPAGTLWLAGIWQWAAIIAAAILIATAITGFCGAYPLLKVDTLKYGKNWPSWVAWVWILVLILLLVFIYIYR